MSPEVIIGVLGVLAILAVIVIFFVSTRPKKSQDDGASCESNDECKSNLCGPDGTCTTPCVSSGTACDSTTKCCGSCGPSGKCIDAVDWVTITGYNAAGPQGSSHTFDSNCQKYCLPDQGCIAAVRTSKGCFTTNDLSQAQAQDDATSYVKFPKDPWLIVRNSAIGDTSRDPDLVTASLEDCQKQCDNDSCLAITFNANTQKCFVNSSFDGFAGAAGYATYIRNK